MTQQQIFSQTIERSLTGQDTKQNIPFPFQVPAGTGQIELQYAYAPKQVDDLQNLLTLTVFDPSGWRGEGHRHDTPQKIIIGPEHASPGFLPGAVQPGDWTVVVNTHMVMPGEALILRLMIRGLAQPGEGAGRGTVRRGLAAGRTAPRGPGWYRGDLHAHTLHSDAKWDVDGLVADARQRGLDFVTLSDHNTISGLAQMDAARADDLLTMGGMELTTFWGHALVLGLREWTDWRVSAGNLGPRGMDDICREVTERGGLFIIAHPLAEGDPICTGCDWRYPGVLPGPARVIEVWNDDWDSGSHNEQALELAYGWLNQGYRLALTAGTDNHGSPGERHFGYDNVYAEELSEQEILKAVRAGRLYLSAGPRLELAADAGSQHAMLGDTLNVEVGTTIRLYAQWAGCPPGSRLEWIVDGQPRERVSVEAQGARSWSLPGGSAHWSLVILREAGGRMVALTNPIYFDGRS